MVEMSEFLQTSEIAQNGVIPSPENAEEAITVVRALEAPGVDEYLAVHFTDEDITTAYTNAHAWYRQHLNSGLPDLRMSGPGALERNGPGPDLDATMPPEAEELMDGAWTDGPDPKAYSALETKVLMAALRRVVQNGWGVQESYESLRTADYLARKAPTEPERRWMGWLVWTAVQGDLELAA
jgi:hypothetical protein